MIIIFVILLVYPLICGVTLLVLNDKCLIPGTQNYKCRQFERQTRLDQERARSAAIQSRYRAAENENLDKQLKLLEAPKS